jgi:hypothetical protein
MIVFNVKECNKCQIKKSILKFNHARNGKFQVTSECKDCRIKYQRKHRQKQRDKINKDKLSNIKNNIKICTTCQQEFPANHEYFHKSSSGKYGLHAKCKRCLRQKYLETRDHRLKKAREYYPKNKERIQKTVKQWRIDNKEKDLVNRKKYRQKHKSQITKYVRNRRKNESDTHEKGGSALFKLSFRSSLLPLPVESAEPVASSGRLRISCHACMLKTAASQ